MPINDLAGFVMLNTEDNDPVLEVVNDTSPKSEPVDAWDWAHRQFFVTTPPRLILVTFLPAVKESNFAPRPSFRVCTGPNLAIKGATPTPDTSGAKKPTQIVLTHVDDAWKPVTLSAGVDRYWRPACIDDGRDPVERSFDAYVVMICCYPDIAYWGNHIFVSLVQGRDRASLGGNRNTDLLRFRVLDSERMKMGEAGDVGAGLGITSTGYTAVLVTHQESGTTDIWRVYRLCGATDYGGPFEPTLVGSVKMYGWMLQKGTEFARSSNRFFMTV